MFEPNRNATFNQNSFITNKASIEGGAIKYINQRPFNLDNNIYQSNQATYGNDFASFPIRIRLIQNESAYIDDVKFILKNQVSNHILFQDLVFGLYDYDDQCCILISSG